MRYFLTILLLFSTAFAADTVITTNKVVMGQKSSAADKVLEFQSNLGAANPKIKVNPATAKIQFANDGTNYKDLGSGGSGSKNFTTFGDAEAGIGTIVGYADAAGTSPVDGVGGSPVSTIAISNVTPLENLNSFIFTKDAVSRQGNGFSLPFTIDLQQRAKVLNISFKYLVNSGTFVAGSTGVDSDVTVWIYDVTNAQLIQPSSYKLLSNSTSISDVFNATFQTASNSSSYRLIFHIGSTSALAYSLKIDDIQVSPSNYVYGTPITDWTSFTTNCGGSWNTNTTYTCKKRRVGDENEYAIKVLLSGAPNAANLTLTIPDAIDTSKLNTTVTNANALKSTGNGLNGGSGYDLKITYASSALTVVYQSSLAALESVVSNTAPVTWASGNEININFSAPILGSSSSIQMSEQTDTRIVNWVGQITTGTALTANVTNIPLVTDKDSHTAWSGTIYTVPVAGDYFLNVTMQMTTAQTLAINAHINGTITARCSNSFAFSISVGSCVLPNLKTGDQISFRSNTAVTTLANATEKFSITRISGPNQIAASEAVYARVYATANLTGVAPNNSAVKVLFDTKDVDSHGGFDITNKRYVAPISGLYEVGLVNLLQATNVLANSYLTGVFKNGSIFAYVSNVTPAVGTQTGMSGSTFVRLNAGDYVETYIFGSGNNSASTLTVTGTFGFSSMTIKRVGN